MKYLVISLAIFFSASAIADAKDAKVRKLFEAQGITVESFKKYIDEEQADNKREAEKILDEVFKQLNPTKEYRDRFSLVADKFINNLQETRNLPETVDVLADYYAAQFSEEELDQLITFYSSEVAKKEADVSDAAMRKLEEYFKESNDKRRSAAVVEYVQDVKLIAKQCNCLKKN